MVFGYRSSGPLPLLLNSGDIGCLSDSVSRVATEACEEFYDTLSNLQDVNSSGDIRHTERVNTG
jgi:hypothetical protein